VHVASRAAQVLTRPQVMACSDSPAFDGQWMQMLLTAGDRHRTLQLVDVNQIYGDACRPLLDRLPPGDGPLRARAEERVRNMAGEIVAIAEEAEHLRPRVQHRALPDAESLWRTWRAIKDEVARRLAEEGTK
jgi:hypothetical protein